MRLNEYLAKHKVEDVEVPTQTPFCWHWGAEGKNFYQALLDDPEKLALFNIAMATEEESLPTLGMYPFENLALEDGSEDRKIIVDVGGGRGHSMVEIIKANPLFSGRIVLQDRKPVLDAVPDEAIHGVEKMPHDFFTPQPVKREYIVTDIQFLSHPYL